MSLSLREAHVFRGGDCMEKAALKPSDKYPISKVPVVRNFQKVIEARDISLMNKELYQFLTLYCGFIAHYDINGFKATYAHPRDFAGVFIRHFDQAHRYFSGIYPCHHEPYQGTGFTKAEIKQEFWQIVDEHKEAIGKWAEQRQKDERYAVYLKLKREFGEETGGLTITCEACGNEYEVRVIKEGEDYNDFGIICCLFCGQQIKRY
jgi:hypothetical protein